MGEILKSEVNVAEQAASIAQQLRRVRPHLGQNPSGKKAKKPYKALFAVTQTRLRKGLT